MKSEIRYHQRIYIKNSLEFSVLNFLVLDMGYFFQIQ